MFADDVRQGLTATPKQLNPAYFYDALGSCLFDAICQLPSYKITRTELSMLETHAGHLVAGLPDPACLIELGCGNGQKIARLVAALERSGRRTTVHLVDVSAEALEQSAHQLQRWPGVEISLWQDRFEAGLVQAIAHCDQGRPVMILFLGSNLGNFDPSASRRFLTGIRECLRPGDQLLLGVDLVKPEAELILAYDDPVGVTAAFNKNILLRINRELGGNFDLAAFAHRAVWNAAASRIEMHLVACHRQQVNIPAAACTIDFEGGESIWTESSYKYQPEHIPTLAAATGFTCAQQILDADRSFALNCLVA